MSDEDEILASIKRINAELLWLGVVACSMPDISRASDLIEKGLERFEIYANRNML